MYPEDFSEESIDFREIINKTYLHWKFFAICIITGLLLAYFYQKFSHTEYTVSTTLLINDEQSSFDPQSIIGFEMSNQRLKLQNEIEILNSYTLKKSVVQELDLDINYYVNKGFKYIDIYKSSPFSIELNKTAPQIVNTLIQVSCNSKDSINISFKTTESAIYNLNEEKKLKQVEEIDFSKSYHINQDINSPYFSFNVSFAEDFNLDKFQEDDYYFSIQNFDAKLSQFSNIKIEDTKESTIIKVILTGTNINKSVDYLNELACQFINRDLTKKNNIAEKTLDFIDTHLSEITDSLTLSEKSLQEFQTSKSAVNLDFQTQSLLKNLEDIENQKAEILIQQKYYKYLYETLTENNDLEDIIAPSLMNVQNNLLNEFIMQLTALNREYNDLKFNTKKEIPALEALKNKIEKLRSVIIKNIDDQNNSIRITLFDLEERINEIQEKVNKFPVTQRQLFGFERKFKLNDALYTFLLKKRSEILIAKASNVPLNEIIDPASIKRYGVVSKSPLLIYFIFLIISILVPAGLLYLKYLINDKIISEDSIEKDIKVPVIGHIPKNNLKNNLLDFNDPNVIISEAFRTLRTNLQFTQKTNNDQVILVTSSVKNEGKSFISTNLAKSFAVNGKKTILIVFDLRNPTNYFDIKKNSEGISNYLVNKFDIKSIIQKTNHENLDVIFSGPIPPNPTELISTKNTTDLFESLKKLYDYIIVDTPPIGIISDALLLTKFSDLNLIVIRHNFTRHRLLARLIKSLKQKNIENVNFIINDISVKKSLYGYNYYNYDYYNYSGYS
jgi:tyrosine-protein kinase Etk/Wzc